MYAGILKASHNHFAEVVETSSLQAAFAMMSAILGSRTPWSESSVLLKDSVVKRALQDVASRDHGQTFCLALRLLALCHLVAAGLGSNPHGTPTVFYIRRPLVQESPAYVHYVNILTLLKAGFCLDSCVWNLHSIAALLPVRYACKTSATLPTTPWVFPSLHALQRWPCPRF